MTQERTPETMMEEIVLKIKEIEDLQHEIEQKKLAIDEIAAPLKNEHPDFVAQLSTKTGYNGIFYSIRFRFNDELKRQVAYVCGSKVPFGAWLKKENRKGKKDDSASSSEGSETP